MTCTPTSDEDCMRPAKNTDVGEECFRGRGHRRLVLSLYIRQYNEACTIIQTAYYI